MQAGATDAGLDERDRIFAGLEFACGDRCLLIAILRVDALAQQRVAALHARRDRRHGLAFVIDVNINLRAVGAGDGERERGVPARLRASEVEMDAPFPRREFVVLATCAFVSCATFITFATRT